jgi:callose synthase
MQYRATGRGFVVRHEKFSNNYRLYSRSHFVKGIEIIFLLIVYQAYGSSKNTTVYILTTVSCWFLGITWILAPFLFNPSGFDWLKSVDDFDDFMTWIWYKGSVFASAQESWHKWWDEEQEHLNSTGFWGKVMEIILDLRFFFFQYGIVYRLKVANGSTSIIVYLISWTYIFAAGLISVVLGVADERYGAKKHLKYRAVQALIAVLLTIAVVLLFTLTNFSIWDTLTSLLAFLPTGYGLVLICQVLRKPFLENTPVWRMVVAVARLYEIAMGVFVMAPVVILSWLPGFQAMQTRILFNEAFSRGLNFYKIVSGKRIMP